MFLHDLIEFDEVLLGESFDDSLSCELDHHWIFSHLDYSIAQ